MTDDWFATRTPDGSGWRPVPALTGDALDDQVGRTAAVLGVQAGRVAASVWFLGAVARLVSPPFAASVLGAADVSGSADVWWRGSDAALEFARTAAPPVVRAEDFVATVVEPFVTPIAHELAQRYRVSRRVLDGNVASAVVGTGAAFGFRYPGTARVAKDFAQTAVRASALRGAGNFGTTGFRRASCCLIYRAPDHGTCGDCLLSHSG